MKEDKKVMFQNAREAGMTATDFILFKTIEKVPKKKVATPLRTVLIKVNASVGKIVSNVNQIAVALSVPESNHRLDGFTHPYTKPVSTDLQNLSKWIISYLAGKNVFNEGIEDSATPKKSFNLEALIELNKRLAVSGTLINEIALALNTSKFGNVNVRIKHEYIQSVLSEARGLSIDILKTLNNGNQGKDEGERSATSTIPDEEG